MRRLMDGFLPGDGLAEQRVGDDGVPGVDRIGSDVGTSAPHRHESVHQSGHVEWADPGRVSAALVEGAGSHPPAHSIGSDCHAVETRHQASIKEIGNAEPGKDLICRH